MKVAVVGSINMDMTVTTQRIPKKGETLKGDSLHYIPGGKGANQAVAIAKLGGNVQMFGCVGDDGAGETLIKNLKTVGVDTNFIHTVENVPTGIALITVGENDNTILVVAGANDCVSKEYVDSIKEELLTADIVLLQHEIPLETVQYVIDLCYEAKVKIVLNPAPAYPLSQDIIDKVTYLTPNEHEAVILFGNEIETEQLLRQYPEKLLITQGVKGVSTALKSGEIVLVPARPAKVADTTGAGDTLNGAFTWKIAEGKSIEEALSYANVAASLSTEKFGAQGGMPTDAEVMGEISNTK